MSTKIKSDADGLASSRRGFLKGAALGSLGAATLSLAGCSEDGGGDARPTAAAEEPWYGSAPSVAEGSIVEDVETDILICGAGHGGLVGALAAAEAGARTLVIEKGPSASGMRRWVGVVNSRPQREAGLTFDTGELVNELARYATSHCSQALLRVWATESGACADWLADRLEPLGYRYVAEYDVGEGWHGAYRAFPIHTKYVPPSAERSFGDGVVHLAEDAGVTFRFRTPLVKLLRGSDGLSGRVTGAIARREDGKHVRITATKAVVLCTGGYAGDPALFARLNPTQAAITAASAAHGQNSGDGIRAGIWVGGRKQLAPCAMIFDRGAVPPGSSAGYPFNPATGSNLFQASQPFLKVNVDGERFCNESAPYESPAHAAGFDSNGTYCMIFDADYWASFARFHTIGCSRLIPSETVPPTLEGWGPGFVEGTFQALMGAGILVRDDTVAGLAARLKLPPGALASTIERYNALADAGRDDDFGKPAKDLIALRTPPFYGVTLGGTVLTTLDGLHIDVHARVTDAARAPIEGLYAAGDTTGGFFAHSYPELLVGVASGRTMTMARHAVLHALGQR